MKNNLISLNFSSCNNIINWGTKSMMSWMSRKDGEKLNILQYSLCFPNDDGDEDDGDEEEEELNIVFFPLYFPILSPSSSISLSSALTLCHHHHNHHHHQHHRHYVIFVFNLKWCCTTLGPQGHYFQIPTRTVRLASVVSIATSLDCHVASVFCCHIVCVSTAHHFLGVQHYISQD